MNSIEKPRKRTQEEGLLEELKKVRKINQDLRLEIELLKEIISELRQK